GPRHSLSRISAKAAKTAAHPVLVRLYAQLCATPRVCQPTAPSWSLQTDAVTDKSPQRRPRHEGHVDEIVGPTHISYMRAGTHTSREMHLARGDQTLPLPVPRLARRIDRQKSSSHPE